MTVAAFTDRIYAGVLGKILGVYHGRPVEGWSYDAIRDRFGEVAYYVAEDTGWPLIVPDDDISGTFVLLRALTDEPTRPLTPEGVGDTWLNHIIENRTVLWWGGLSRSTEHTVYLRLKEGVTPPASGSLALNGASMAEQVGAQIFADGWALANPSDPDRAVAMARAAVSVSHDGLALDAASLLVAMEAAAFEESDVDALLELGLGYVSDRRLLQLVDDVRSRCADTQDWRDVRDWIEHHHGYDRYPSNSPAATNHAAILMALLLGGDSWQRASTIIVSAGWDTDSNAGNLGCLNGIRLGLSGLDAGAPFREPVADRAYVVGADGGACVTDAVQLTRSIVRAGSLARGEVAPHAQPRFAFELPGSTQGWRPATGGVDQACRSVSNNGGALDIVVAGLAPGTHASVVVDTWVDPQPRGVTGTSYFEVVASPSLYPTQVVRATLETELDGVLVAPYVEVYGDDLRVEAIAGHLVPLRGRTELAWPVPQTAGRPVYRFGLRLTASARVDGVIRLLQADWSGAPTDLRLGRAEELSPALTPWTTDTVWLRSFVSSASHLAPDYTTTMCVSHTGRHGLVTTGTTDWSDYEVSSRITFNANLGAGLVARANGHRRYYAGLLRDGRAQLVAVVDGIEHVLATADVSHEVDETHTMTLRVRGDRLELRLDDFTVTARDSRYACGGAGFVMNEGAMLVEGFRARRLPPE